MPYVRAVLSSPTSSAASLAERTRRNRTSTWQRSFPTPPPKASKSRFPVASILPFNSKGAELKGKIALEGKLLFEDDEVARVRWESTTRKIYLDERYRIERSHREFLETLSRG